MSLPFILRDNVPEDTSFIYNSYLKSYHLQYPIYYIPNILYFKSQSKILDTLLETQQVLIACYPEDPSEIIGYIIYDNKPDVFVLHYIYIKGMYHHKGIASNILSQILNDHKLIITTHIHDDFSLLKKKIPNCKMIYNPFQLESL
jgi:hypothetical protein